MCYETVDSFGFCSGTCLINAVLYEITTIRTAYPPEVDPEIRIWLEPDKIINDHPQPNLIVFFSDQLGRD